MINNDQILVTGWLKQQQHVSPDVAYMLSRETENKQINTKTKDLE